MAITLTERAAEEVARVKESQSFDETMSLRVGVAGGGCSGFSYSCLLYTSPSPRDS